MGVRFNIQIEIKGKDKDKDKNLTVKFKVKGLRFNVEVVKLGLRLWFKTNVFEEKIIKNFINIMILQIFHQNILDITLLIFQKLNL